MQSGQIELKDIDRRLGELREQISDTGQQIDSYRAKTAAALGGGVFLLLLAIGACYEIIADNPLLWLPIRITRLAFYFIAGALIAASLGLLALAWMRERRRDLACEAKLDELEEEFAMLTELKKTAADERQ